VLDCPNDPSPLVHAAAVCLELRRRNNLRSRVQRPPLVPRRQAAKRFAALTKRYRRERRPIPVSFRDLAKEIGHGERVTHRLHSYPATLLRSIPAFFLAVPKLTPSGTTVGDPFCGSGTVLLEAMCAGFGSYGLDVNPLAALISRVKTRYLNPTRLAAMQRDLLGKRHRAGRSTAPPVVNIGHWFYPHIVEQLAQIDAALHTLPTGRYSEFFRVCFSSCVRRVSLANPRVSVPVRLRPEAYPEHHPLRRTLAAHLNQLERANAWEILSRIIDANRVRVGHLAAIAERPPSTVRVGDVRAWTTRERHPPTRCSLLITSPPYLGAQKYVRATSLSLNWLRLADPRGLRPLERLTLGREHINKNEYISLEAVPPSVHRLLDSVRAINPLRAQIAAHYLVDLGQFFDQVPTWLSPSGYCVLVVGPNTVCGVPFDTPAVARDLACDYGLQVTVELVDTIRSRGLMTRRNRNAATINREHVLVLRRVGQ